MNQFSMRFLTVGTRGHIFLSIIKAFFNKYSYIIDTCKHFAVTVRSTYILLIII